MLEKFNNHLSTELPFLRNTKLLVAISGGIDSVVMTHLLNKLNYKISLAHCNFKLRMNDSDLDESFIKNLGNTLKIKTLTKQFNTKKYSEINKLSLQVSARKLRYDWFNFLTEKYNFKYVLTAHQANDNLETFIINLTRTTGLDGLTGIPVLNNKIVRPFLIFNRDEILKYAITNKISWREDVSNLETKYIRNKVRHEIIPKLKEINPSLLNSFLKTSIFLKQSQQIIDDQINNISKDIISYENDIIKFNIKKIEKLSNPKAYLYQLLKKYGFSEWNNIYSLLKAQTGKTIITKKFLLLKNRDFLLLSSLKLKKHKLKYFIENTQKKISTPIKILIKNSNKNEITDKHSILVDKESLDFPLIIRRWESGDVFFPTGMKGKKKLSKFFKDKKFSIFQKQKIWLLCSSNNKIIWIVGIRQDRRFLTNKNTKKVIKIIENTPEL